jgi:hypothetical protein
VSTSDFLIVLNRLYRLKEASKSTPGFSTEKLFSNYSQCLLRKEEFKVAIEVFGYREEDLNPLFSPNTVMTIRSALEGHLG